MFLQSRILWNPPVWKLWSYSHCWSRSLLSPILPRRNLIDKPQRSIYIYIKTPKVPIIDTNKVHLLTDTDPTLFHHESPIMSPIPFSLQSCISLHSCRGKTGGNQQYYISAYGLSLHDLVFIDNKISFLNIGSWLTLACFRSSFRTAKKRFVRQDRQPRCPTFA